jgi:formylglycine-generating enzyme required for sulfatase activity
MRLKTSDMIGIVALFLGIITVVIFSKIPNRIKNHFASISIPEQFIPELITLKLDLPTKTKNIKFAKYEVTIAQWRYCFQTGGCSYMPKTLPNISKDHPITGINWQDAMQYISWLSKYTKTQYRLPTSLEWDFIANDMIDKNEKKLFNDPRLAWAADYINYEVKSKITSKIGSFGKNQFGIYDLTGNVWEWTADCFTTDFIETEVSTKKQNCRVRILQGEHKSAISDFIRNPLTGGCSIGQTPTNIGFRIVSG